jgi:hypothetical protein
MTSRQLTYELAGFAIDGEVMNDGEDFKMLYDPASARDILFEFIAEARAIVCANAKLRRPRQRISKGEIAERLNS